MKIVQENQDFLIIENKNLLAIVVSFVLFLTGLVMFFFEI